MDLQQIKQLIAKYYEAETSHDEETQLKEWLKSYTGNDSELLEAKKLFGFYADEAHEEVDISFESIITEKTTIKFRPIVAWISSVAAVLLIAFSLTFLTRTPKQPVVYAYINGKPITNKELAMKDTKKALMLMSASFNKGTDGLTQLSKLNEPMSLLTK